MNKNVAKVAVKLYTERDVLKVDVCADPVVSGTFALRAMMEDDEVIDFLVVGYNPTMGSKAVSQALEECMFETFPPTSGKVKFFV
jgi:hypothetical protein